ncbi:hypothetical protein BDB00DRAFT_743132, partial [Zychaea mexicana]|uniref:uncharacterized protein n=1 Tax=Zychaea mexicana TaxID=64656 RepID=UPI0022FDC8C5
MFGRKPILPSVANIQPPAMKSHNAETWIAYLNHYLPVLQGQIKANIQKAQLRQKRYYDQ